MADHSKRQDAKDARAEAADKATADAPPDWDRMGQIADRLLSTPPDRQAVGGELEPKRKRTTASNEP